MAIPLSLSEVPNETPYVQYVATNGQTVYPYPFPITQDSDLVVDINGIPLATDTGYSLSGQGNDTGGNVTLSSGSTAGDIVTLFRDIQIERLTQFSQNGGFSSSAFNAEFNNLYLIAQQLEASIEQCLQIPNTNNPAPTTVLAPVAYAGKYLAFDSNGNPTPAVLTTSGSLTAQIVASLLSIYTAGAITPDRVRTSAEVVAGVTPANFAYGPDHIGDDVRRYGNIDLTGVTDCRAILNTANSVGVALYLPKGIYKISSALTLNVPLYFEYGAILKPDANITVTINAPVWAGPWQIFNLSNSNSLINGLLRPITYGVRIPVEWMGAVGDNVTNDTTAFANTAVLAKAAGNIGIQLQAKTYFINATIYANGSGSGGQSFYAPSWFGIEKRQTYISLRGAALGTPALLFQGGSGQGCGATVQDIGFKGDANSVGISFEGQDGMRAIRCLFDTNVVGVRFYNNQAGSYTEYCVAEQCEFTALCLTDVQYARNLGASSFNGSGLMQCLSNKSGGQCVLIGAGVSPYNAPLDLQIWNAAATTLVNNGSTTNVWFHGNLTFETLAGALTLATNNPVYFSGTIAGDNELVTGGTFIQCEAFQANSTGAVCALGVRKAYSQAAVSGTNVLSSSSPGSTKLIDVRATATNYDWRGTFVITHNGTGAAGYPYTIGTTLVNNTAGLGAPSIAVDNSGNLLVTNAAYSAGVTIRWSEKSFGAGIVNGAVATF